MSSRSLTSKILFAAAFALNLCGLSLLPSAVSANDIFSEPQKAEIQSIIKGYLLENPEILREAFTELEHREELAQSLKREKALSDPQSPLFTSQNQEVIGNPDGKITLIEFFDYNCHYCKDALEDISHLMKDSPDVRVILRDFPILAPESKEAAAIALAAHNQLKGDKFWEFHQKLLSMRGVIGKAQALAVAKDLGANMDQLAKDAASQSVKDSIEENYQIAKGLQIDGTPSYILGNEVLVGRIKYDDMKAKVDNMRKCGKAICS
jgi:protein-disulfide isomerase